MPCCFAGLCEKQLQIVASQREELQRSSDLSTNGTVILPTNLYTDQNIKRFITAKFLGCVTCDTTEHHTYEEPVVYLIISCARSETNFAYMVEAEKKHRILRIISFRDWSFGAYSLSSLQ